jgi:aldehyde:ferredoxin oxidoreductase
VHGRCNKIPLSQVQSSTATTAAGRRHSCELDEMLEEYYKERGWEDGVVPESKLKELEII